MFRFIVLTIMLMNCSAARSDALPSPLPEKLYFSNNWCPRTDELLVLSKHLKLEMNGCCIREAIVLDDTFSHPEVLDPWAHRVMLDEYPNLPCNGIALTKEEEIKGISSEEFQKRLNVSRRSSAINSLKAMTKERFCIAYGWLLNGEVIHEIGELPDALLLFKKEAKRRKFGRLDDNMIKEGKIKLGMSECELYASWGIPEEKNQSVGQWGINVQHVYGNGTYVYTENGKVTSWQN